ncbi:MAG: RNA polymerase factor sigma-54 [Chlorobiaceae bacterium]
MSGIKLQQKQTALLSAQQILSSQLLQLPLLTLEERIYEELQENPLLELVEERKDSVDSVPDSMAQSDENMFDSVDRFSKSLLKQRSDLPYSSTERGGNVTYKSGSKEPFFQAVQHDSFHEMLLKQLVLCEGIGKREGRIALEILGNLDGDGYFTEEYEIVINGLKLEGLDVSTTELETVLRKIQFLDPPGVATKDLRERLFVQLRVGESRYQPETYATALKILFDHFDDFLHRRFERILKHMGTSSELLESAFLALAGLEPHPCIFQDDGSHYIIPDFLVTYENGALTAVLNDVSTLSVMVTERYKELLKERKLLKEEKKFIRQNLQRANEFTSAIETRRQTLLKVIQALMVRQYEFFIFGPERVVPLGMKTLASDTGLDISTISRAVNGKYVQTCYGVFELKYFFGGGLLTESGDDLSSKTIRQYIAEMVREEKPENPLSDESITELLMKKGIHIARRTVAKYREQMQIPVGRLRKKIF